jgi:hypothetical protein
MVCLKARKPSEEWDSAGNYQLIGEESTRGIRFRQELLAYLIQTAKTVREILQTETFSESAFTVQIL